MDDDTYAAVLAAVDAGMTAATLVRRDYDDQYLVMVVGLPGVASLFVDVQSGQLRQAMITPTDDSTERYFTPDLARGRLLELVA